MLAPNQFPIIMPEVPGTPLSLFLSLFLNAAFLSSISASFISYTLFLFRLPSVTSAEEPARGRNIHTPSFHCIFPRKVDRRLFMALPCLAFSLDPSNFRQEQDKNKHRWSTNPIFEGSIGYMLSGRNATATVHLNLSVIRTTR